jgi:hypothetical protein
MALASTGRRLILALNGAACGARPPCLLEQHEETRMGHAEHVRAAAKAKLVFAAASTA